MSADLSPGDLSPEEQARAEERAVARYVGAHFGIGSEVPASADILVGGLDPEEEAQDRPRAGGLFGPA